MDQSDAGSVGIFSLWTNQTQEAWVYSHYGPIGRRKRGYILIMDQSDAGSVGIISLWTNQTQEAWVYSHDGPIRRKKRGYILTMDQSNAGSVGICIRIERLRHVSAGSADAAVTWCSGCVSLCPLPSPRPFA
eukprot:9287115-Pyramimonas_sp.AAC.1